MLCCVYLFCDRFNGFHWFCVKNLCTKHCCKSLNKQSSGVQERINTFYINSYGENSFGFRTFRFTNISVYEHFGLRTFRFTNDLQERIKFVNRGLTVLNYAIFWSLQKYTNLSHNITARYTSHSDGMATFYSVVKSHIITRIKKRNE